jgi:hypothetical protein
MIRTAEEILKSKYSFTAKTGEEAVYYSDAIKAINESRIETINECAEVAKAVPLEVQDDFEMSVPQVYLTQVDKQSILKLVDQIK